MPDQIAIWHRDHVNFVRLLDLLETQINIFHDAGHPNYELMLDVMYYMIHYPNQFHHPKEDVAFKKVAKKDNSMESVVTDLMTQHQVIAERGKRLFEQLDAVVAGAMMTRESVESPGRTYISYMRNHMNQEETQLFPTALKKLRIEDWIAVDAAIKSQEDPLFGGTVQKRYEALLQQIAREAECGCQPASQSPRMEKSA